jgi:LysR family transcriptional activator of nhaA
MLRDFARAGHGFARVPSILEEQFRKEYGIARVGVASGIKAEFYAISVERKIRNPAVAEIIEHGREAFLSI